jgi:hypothetical protein
MFYHNNVNHRKVDRERGMLQLRLEDTDKERTEHHSKPSGSPILWGECNVKVSKTNSFYLYLIIFSKCNNQIC